MQATTVPPETDQVKLLELAMIETGMFIASPRPTTALTVHSIFRVLQAELHFLVNLR
jgi:hypothetical protein